MNSIKKAELIVIFIVAILSFGMSNITALFTEDYINFEISNINNETQSLIAIEDGNFSPNHIKKVPIVNDSNTTKNSTIKKNESNNTPSNTSKNDD